MLFQQQGKCSIHVLAVQKEDEASDTTLRTLNSIHAAITHGSSDDTFCVSIFSPSKTMHTLNGVSTWCGEHHSSQPLTYSCVPIPRWESGDVEKAKDIHNARVAFATTLKSSQASHFLWVGMGSSISSDLITILGEVRGPAVCLASEGPACSSVLLERTQATAAVHLLEQQGQRGPLSALWSSLARGQIEGQAEGQGGGQDEGQSGAVASPPPQGAALRGGAWDRQEWGQEQEQQELEQEQEQVLEQEHGHEPEVVVEEVDEFAERLAEAAAGENGRRECGCVG
jgi:hypothetical protein